MKKSGERTVSVFGQDLKKKNSDSVFPGIHWEDCSEVE